MKKVWALILTAAVCLYLSIPFSAAEPTQKSVIEDFKKGIYIGDWVPCTLSEQTVREMAESGIQYTFLWDFNYDNPAKVQELEWCSKYGIKVFLIDHRIRGTVMKDMSAEQILSYIGPSIGNPNILGYCIYDEPGEKAYEDIAAALKNYYAVSEGMIGTVNLYPNIYGSYIDRVFTTLGQDYVSVDIYPLENHTTQAAYYYNLKEVGDSAREHGGDFWLFIQSMGWGSHRIPDIYDMRWQMWSGLAFGATKLMHFCYSNPAFYPTYDPHFAADGYSAVNNGEKSDLYPVIQQVNTEFQYLASVMADYSDLGIFTIAEQNEMPSYMFRISEKPQYESFRTIKSIFSNQSVLVGAFSHDEDDLKKGFIVVNASDVAEEGQADVSFTLRYTDGPVSVTYDGETESLSPDKDGVYHLHLGAGGGAFVEVSEREKTQDEYLMDQYYEDCFAVKNAYLDMSVQAQAYDPQTFSILEAEVLRYDSALQSGRMSLEELTAARTALQSALVGVKTFIEVATELATRMQAWYMQTDGALFEESGYSRLTALNGRLETQMTEPVDAERLSYTAQAMQRSFDSLEFIGLSGDMTQDGAVTLVDIVRAAKYVLGSIPPHYTQMRIGDMDGDRILKLNDVLLIAGKVLSGE